MGIRDAFSERGDAGDDCLVVRGVIVGDDGGIWLAGFSVGDGNRKIESEAESGGEFFSFVGDADYFVGAKMGREVGDEEAPDDLGGLPEEFRRNGLIDFWTEDKAGFGIADGSLFGDALGKGLAELPEFFWGGGKGFGENGGFGLDFGESGHKKQKTAAVSRQFIFL